ncbi:4-alpha-glucanotransferase [Acidiferrimicrobium sp. IK]|uniref:4-alpha-glucanotransferase n=1 Tax=Acidiferrimicrobium sp. IK TaxID=2871700 RepID=UPI0021CB7280|nr:4-alpha-glucanotransferase [Acidiferrimicrobium sp. IK]MCU4183821.1 4-alpha-glucanotransferase [Acidiferrimicrobium sp. IK]
MIDPKRWGVEPGYHDAMGAWREPGDEVVGEVLDAMGAQSGVDPYDGVPVLAVRLDHQLPPVAPGVLTLEDGATVRVDGQLPADLPLGYHQLHPDSDAAPFPLIASPGRCPDAGAPRWGWAAQLYATRSRASWGIGDLADLRRLARWSSGLGAGITLINPLHAAPPLTHQQPSPYFASSRCFANPLYLRVEDIAAGSTDGIDELAAAGRALNAERRIDRDRVWALKSAALEGVFARFGGDPDFDRFCHERGSALLGYATWSALAEIHGVPWQEWPAELRRPDSAAVQAFSSSGEGPRRIRYHQWLQWHLDRQLAAAGAEGGLMQDLAIGVDAGGADAWVYQDTFADGMRVGAPPDEFNTLGQDWGLPPWDPWKLRDAGYRPFIETVRAGLRHAGGLRFDHVMGLFRLYWIPEDRSAAQGTYVRYPYWDLLNILALEAQRAGAFVVGEDLGTVEDHVRAELAERDVLSYRLLWFEPGPPTTWPRQALGAVTTHDLPTVAGVWSGSDLDAQRRLELSPNEEGSEAMRAKLADATGSGDATPVEDVVDGAYRLLAEAPCAVVTATLDDALAVEERPNMPGTTTAWPNWSLALPSPIEDLETAPLALRIAEHLRRRSVAPPGG